MSASPRRSTAERSPKALLGVASIAVALAAADTYVVVLALTDMMTGVGVGIDSLQKATPIISGFLLGYVAVLPLIGRLADLLDRQRILLGCLAIFVVGSAITAMAPELSVLVVGRVLQGLGGGGLVPATLALVAQLWPPGKRGTPLGVVGAVQEIGSVVGPLLGALILTIWDWRAIFWVNAVAGVLLAVAVRVIGGPVRPTPGTRPRWWRPVAAVTAVAGVAGAVLLTLALTAPSALTSSIRWGGPFVPYGAHTSRMITPIGVWAMIALAIALVLTVPLLWRTFARVDLPGAALIGVALGALILTFATSDPSKQVIGPLGLWLLPVAAVAAGLFVWRQRSVSDPLVASGVVRRRVTPALACSLFAGTALVSIVVDVPLLAQLTVAHSTERDGALILLRFLVAVPVGALVGGLLLRQFGPGLIAPVGLAVAAVGLLVMSTWGNGSLESLPAWFVLIAVGFGIGLSIAPINDAALHDAAPDQQGVVSALVVVSRMIGMVVGLGLLTALGLHQFYDRVAQIPNATDTQIAAAAVVQVQTIFLGAAIAGFAAALIAIALGIRRIPVHHLIEETDAREPVNS
ncbi:MFS transporter [Allobranchiibius sp. GilTou38]|nr:MFS transporter [Allobranchiibius sp. GilTou38]MBO1767138.1 MFS transporter [Allobranchiibius sp. GilTou38]